MDESPKWLLSAGHEARARKLLAKIIRINKLDDQEDIDIDAIIRDTSAALMKVIFFNLIYFPTLAILY